MVPRADQVLAGVVTEEGEGNTFEAQGFVCRRNVGCDPRSSRYRGDSFPWESREMKQGKPEIAGMSGFRSAGPDEQPDCALFPEDAD